jgi:hypothetical protein
MSTTSQNTTTQSIQQTVESTLRASGNGSYLSYAGPTIAALMERERTICSALLDYADNAGASDGEVRDLLASLGMNVEPDIQAQDAEDDEDSDDEDGSDTGALSRIEASLRTLTATVSSLTDFARRNGYRA